MHNARNLIIIYVNRVCLHYTSIYKFHLIYLVFDDREATGNVSKKKAKWILFKWPIGLVTNFICNEFRKVHVFIRSTERCSTIHPYSIQNAIKIARISKFSHFIGDDASSITAVKEGKQFQIHHFYTRRCLNTH